MIRNRSQTSASISDNESNHEVSAAITNKKNGQSKANQGQRKILLNIKANLEELPKRKGRQKINQLEGESIFDEYTSDIEQGYNKPKEAFQLSVESLLSEEAPQNEQARKMPSAAERRTELPFKKVLKRQEFISGAG